MLEWLRSKIKRLRKDPWRIEVNDAEVLSLYSQRVVARIRWDEIRKITATKMDRLTYDPIVVLLEGESAGSKVELEELKEGYEEFLNELHARWDTIDQSWINEVNGNAFEPNTTILWERV